MLCLVLKLFSAFFFVLHLLILNVYINRNYDQIIKYDLLLDFTVVSISVASSTCPLVAFSTVCFIQVLSRFST